MEAELCQVRCVFNARFAHNALLHINTATACNAVLGHLQHIFARLNNKKALHTNPLIQHPHFDSDHNDHCSYYDHRRDDDDDGSVRSYGRASAVVHGSDLHLRK